MSFKECVGSCTLLLLLVAAGSPAYGLASGFLTPDEIRTLFSELNSPHTTPKQPQIDLPSLDEVITPEEQRELDVEKAEAPELDDEPTFGGVRSFVDLRNRDSSIKEQRNKACTAYSLVAALENALDSQGKINLSEPHFWSFYRRYSVSAAIRAALANKITDVEFWPYYQAKPNPGYQEAAKTLLISAPSHGGKVEAAISALSRDHAVYIGMRVPSDMTSCRSVIRPNSRATRGAHALAVVGYRLDPQIKGGGYFILKNSWGTDCGDQGYQYLAFHNCKRSDMYCKFWEIETVQR